MAPAAPAGRCVVIPTFKPHHPFFNRLLQSVRSYATDAARVRIIAVFSEPASEAAASFCASFPESCDGALRWEATSLAIYYASI